MDGRIGKLDEPILHFSYRDIADHVATINRFSRAARWNRSRHVFTPFQMFTNPMWRFFNFYILRGGFRDGGRGLYAAMTAAFYVFLKYAKLYERSLKSRSRTFVAVQPSDAWFANQWRDSFLSRRDLIT